VRKEFNCIFLPFVLVDRCFGSLCLPRTLYGEKAELVVVVSSSPAPSPFPSRLTNSGASVQTPPQRSHTTRHLCSDPTAPSLSSHSSFPPFPSSPPASSKQSQTRLAHHATLRPDRAALFNRSRYLWERRRTFSGRRRGIRCVASFLCFDCSEGGLR
jgi:hypothetical protein